jgi:hypothetical protein
VTDRRKLLALAATLAVATTVFVFLPISPEREPQTPERPANRLPDEFHGRWYFGETSGGIAGQRTAVADGSWIVITPQNTIEHYSAEGRLTSTETFEPSRGRSIFSASEGWILGGGAAIERVIAVHADGVLSISENVYDGFGSTYTRER